MYDKLIYQQTGFQQLTHGVGRLPEVEMIEMELNNAIEGSQDTVYKMCSHTLNAGGKRIRPIMVMYSGLVFGTPSQELLQAAVASELIHMASLVHDDIIDKANIRRNKPSVNHKWGSHFAVLCGDYLFAKAFGVLAKNRLIESMDYMVKAIENMCQGEISQASGRFDHNVSKESYYKRIAQKTAIFIECCCKSGATVGGADSRQVSIIGEYGLNIGYAFQIIDDILDICGDSDVMGKPCFEDLKDGIITLPIILLLQNDEYGDWMRDVIQNREFTQENFNRLKYILSITGIIQQVYEIAALHIEKSVGCLKLLPQNRYTEYLSATANSMKWRKH